MHLLWFERITIIVIFCFVYFDSLWLWTAGERRIPWMYLQVKLLSHFLLWWISEYDYLLNLGLSTEVTNTFYIQDFVTHKNNNQQQQAERHRQDIKKKNWKNYHTEWYMQSCWAKRVDFRVLFHPSQTFASTSRSGRLIVGKYICTCGYFYEASKVWYLSHLYQSLSQKKKKV